MTQNQIAYWNMVYANRHNERADAETARSNYAREAETHRTNVANEALKASDVFGNLEINQNKLYETQRHNLADESLNQSKLEETRRHNLAEEEIGSSNTLRQWFDTGLNPAMYTNAATAAATYAIGLLSLGSTQGSKMTDYASQVTDIVSNAFGKTTGLFNQAKNKVSSSYNSLVNSSQQKLAKFNDSQKNRVNQALKSGIK